MTTTNHMARHGSLVVGVDRSDHGRRALSVAIDLARRLHLPCHAVHAWAYPAMAVASPYAAATWPLIDLGPGETTWLAGLLASVEPDGVAITSEVTRGPAGPALVDVAAELEAPFIIVGSVGHGAIVGVLLGSVSEYCVHHATCPVVVVPPHERTVKASHADQESALVAARELQDSEIGSQR